MRAKVRRHLGGLMAGKTLESESLRLLRAEAAGVGGPQKPITSPREFNAHQYAVLLLSVAAEIEHALMVEYLYAAFSLGGPQLPPAQRTEVAQWRETILGIAKEEMGHLMTVQNLLRCIGGPLNLDREDYPWDSELYPFPFRLEPLTRQALAKFVYAESPAPEVFTGPEAMEIRKLAEEDTNGRPVHRVGALYSLLRSIFTDPTLLRDADFRGETYPFQANWDEWGRGYKGGSRGNAMGGAMPGTPDLLLLPVTSRSDALAAIQAVATQGEANPTADESAPSHFARFLRIFRQFPKDGEWTPARDVPVNPIVWNKIGDGDDEGSREGTPITHPETMLWAHLFNIRYRSLLVTLLRTFEYASNLSETSELTPRGLLIHGTFGEMYNLHSLSQILVQMPLELGGSKRVAGPPFEMPYTLRLPVDPIDRWHLQLDLLDTSKILVELLLGKAFGTQEKYLTALKQTDCQTKAMIETILRGNGKCD